MINALHTGGFVPFVFLIMLINPILKKNTFSSAHTCLIAGAFEITFPPFGFKLKQSKSRPITDVAENALTKAVHQGIHGTSSIRNGSEVRKFPFTIKLFALYSFHSVGGRGKSEGRGGGHYLGLCGTDFWYFQVEAWARMVAQYRHQ